MRVVDEQARAVGLRLGVALVPAAVIAAAGGWRIALLALAASGAALATRLRFAHQLAAAVLVAAAALALLTPPADRPRHQTPEHIQ